MKIYALITWSEKKILILFLFSCLVLSPPWSSSSQSFDSATFHQAQSTQEKYAKLILKAQNKQPRSKGLKWKRAFGGNYNPSNENIHLKDKTNSDAGGEVGETNEVRLGNDDPLAIRSPWRWSDARTPPWAVTNRFFVCVFSRFLPAQYLENTWTISWKGKEATWKKYGKYPDNSRQLIGKYNRGRVLKRTKENEEW